MKFKLYQDRRGKWRWRLVSRNGKLPGQEAFASKSNARRSAWRTRHKIQCLDVPIEVSDG